MVAIVNARNDTPRYMFAHLLEPRAEGSTFGDWPLHITLVPWFKLNTTPTEFIAGTSDQINRIEVFDVQLGRIAYLAWVRVRQVMPSEELQGLHETVLDVSKKLGQNVARLNYVADKFWPHVTPKKKQPSVRKGQQILISRFELIRKIPKYERTDDNDKLVKHVFYLESPGEDAT